jgi:predicted ATPase
MIKSVQIKNFKSVIDLSLDLGSFNVLIGENGCGKSNILEAIAFGGAASADKLDFEFFGSRGIRATNPEFMFSAFTNGKSEKSISLIFQTNDKERINYALEPEAENSKKWKDRNKKDAFELFTTGLAEKEKKEGKKWAEFKKADDKTEKPTTEDLINTLVNDSKFIEAILEIMNKTDVSKLATIIYSHPDLSNFIIYSPEQSSLRKFEDTTQIYPLGIKGEGLFQYLKEVLTNPKSKKLIAEIKENLALLDWYEDFALPENLMSNEYALKIKDRYLYSNLQYFDQRSTNEGFLYLLFYITLFISKDTPAFFAIDNIDTSFNPKLCEKLTRNLAALAKKHKKQVILTTHNPAILDGLNLKDDNQRLFVVRRNDEGHTKATRVEYKAERNMKLSEVWTNGFIGGLPENF